MNRSHIAYGLLLGFTVLLLGGLPTMSVKAGEATGPVAHLIVRDSDGLVYVTIAGTPTGRPPCAAGTWYFMISNESSETGKKLYALLLGARFAGATVQIIGKNTCTRWGDGEDILYVQVLP